MAAGQPSRHHIVRRRDQRQPYPILVDSKRRDGSATRHCLKCRREDSENGVLVVADKPLPLIIETGLLRDPLRFAFSPLHREPLLGVLSSRLTRTGPPRPIKQSDTTQGMLFVMPVHSLTIR
ncbi:hypothetical protein Apa02nite_064270 [Actinoplanes palleronii]|uniref:Uncharacterized protein n=1 Tax=Actinoplanes palleronii TaxID=113570 RepID=A0ABQ4BI30_9ACTN|nr:hypothetical protein Apa02nite_064270 [Actinoplanes palleronii]